MATETRELVKEIIFSEFHEHGIDVVQIILFGSRARGNSTPESDWDFLIVVEKPFSRQQKQEVILSIHKRLAPYRIGADIIVKSKEQFQFERDDVGFLTYYAVREGVAA